MNPRALLSDVAELEKIRIQPGFLQSILEEWFVSSGRAGRNYNPVQLIFLNGFFDELLRFFGAGVEVFFAVYDIFQRLYVFHHFWYIHNSTNVHSTTTNEHPYPWFLNYLSLRRKLLFTSQLIPGRPEDRLCFGGGTACLCDAIGYIFRALGAPADKHAVDAGFQWPFQIRVNISILV